MQSLYDDVRNIIYDRRCMQSLYDDVRNIIYDRRCMQRLYGYVQNFANCLLIDKNLTLNDK